MTPRPAPRPLVPDAHSPPDSPGALTLYLLHAERPVGRTRHYLGITRTDRLELRWHEHAMQRGASLTAALAKRNSRLLVARLWHNATWAQEARIKAAGHYAGLCPVCRSDDPSDALHVLPCPDLVDLEAAQDGTRFPGRLSAQRSAR